MLSRVNALRSTGLVCGGVTQPPTVALSWNMQLQNAANVHAHDMSANNFISHTGSNGRTPDQRAIAAGYSSTNVGENAAGGQQSIQEVVDAWVASPGHCTNLMNARWRDVGVSCARNPASQYGVYWVMDVGG
jgi:uncharacterized protein YkwD